MSADVDPQEIADAELLANLRVQTDAAIAELPPEQRTAFKALRAEYATYAEINAHHLEGNRRRLRKAVEYVVAGGVALAFVLIGLGVYGLLLSGQVSSNQNEVNANQARNTAALCAYHDDLAKRVAQSQAFIATHPNGFAGISQQTIQVSIDNEKSALLALAPLRCPEPNVNGKPKVTPLPPAKPPTKPTTTTSTSTSTSPAKSTP